MGAIYINTRNEYKIRSTCIMCVSMSRHSLPPLSLSLCHCLCLCLSISLGLFLSHNRLKELTELNPAHGVAAMATVPMEFHAAGRLPTIAASGYMATVAMEFYATTDYFILHMYLVYMYCTVFR